MMVVSDASPLVSLSRIRKVDLLRRLYGNLAVPPAVWEEVVVAGRGRPGADLVRTADWFDRRPPINQQLVRALRQDLDAGESEAIVLALEQDGLLLMDERLGREVARHMGVACIGLVGVLLEAKEHGCVSSIRELLDALREEAGFRLSDTLYQRVLRDAGEL